MLESEKTLSLISKTKTKNTPATNLKITMLPNSLSKLRTNPYRIFSSKKYPTGFLLKNAVYIASFGSNAKYFGQVTFGSLLNLILGAHTRVLSRAKIIIVWTRIANFGDKTQSPEKLKAFLQQRMVEHFELGTGAKPQGNFRSIVQHVIKQSHVGFHSDLSEQRTRDLCIGWVAGSRFAGNWEVLSEAEMLIGAKQLQTVVNKKRRHLVKNKHTF